MYPFSIPACIIEYSPLTWYAIVGILNVCFTSRKTSKYASAGLTIIASVPS